MLCAGDYACRGSSGDVRTWTTVSCPPSTSGVLGLMTDRDICMAIPTMSRPKQGLQLPPDDDVKEALKTMAAQQVRHQPVVDEDGLLSAIVSLNNLILRPGELNKTTRRSFRPSMSSKR